MKTLKEIRKLYPTGSQFYSATKNLKSPLTTQSLTTGDEDVGVIDGVTVGVGV